MQKGFRTLLSLFATVAPVLAAIQLINVTVDDQHSLIQYAPVGVWNIGQECTGCTAHIEPNQTYNGTWHDVSFNPSQPGQEYLETMTFSFSGKS